MYYQNLMSIKENLLTSEEYAKQLILKIDNWLASLSSQGLERVNPYQFALECNSNERDSFKVFVEGVNKGLFRVTYEVRSDDDEYIGVISDKQYHDLLIEGKKLILYSRYSDNLEEYFVHNIEIWFSVNMIPTKIPEVIDSTKKVVAPPVTGGDQNIDLIIEMMGRSYNE